MGAEPSAQGAPITYPETDRMGEGELQRLITELFRPLLAEFLASRGVIAHVGADQFLYFAEGVPTERIAPDIYALPGVPQARVEPSWKIWELEAPPAFVLEIVSRDVAKDYEDVPVACDRMGVDELIVFDPGAPAVAGRVVRRDLDRVRFQVYRRHEGRLVRVTATNDDRVDSRWLGAWVRAVGDPTAHRPRARGRHTGPHRRRARGDRAATRRRRGAAGRRAARGAGSGAQLSPRSSSLGA
jgi:Uma2 family endonuclease